LEVTAVKIVLPGGSGHIGTFLGRALAADGHDVVVLSRGAPALPAGVRGVRWDGRTVGTWAAELDGCDAVVNLAGRSVSCRYTEANLREMLRSRVDSARAVGAAIARAAEPPGVWLQMSTATIYAHTYGPAHDESGELGGAEPDVPGYWAYSVRIAREWEAAQADADTPRTRRVALRTAIAMSTTPGGPFTMLSGLVRLGLGGPVAGGRQYVSWLHEADLVRAVRFLLARADVTGPVNLAAPNPLAHKDFMRGLRAAWHVPAGLPATRWMAALGAFALRSDTELLLKSRRVVPGRLTAAGFAFEHPDWPAAARDLVGKVRRR
jgi:uncharacterized protein (TIGR01777 family)